MSDRSGLDPRALHRQLAKLARPSAAAQRRVNRFFRLSPPVRRCSTPS